MYSKAKLKELAKEELATSKAYAKAGLKKFAQDEARHAAFFKMMAKKKK